MSSYDNVLLLLDSGEQPYRIVTVPSPPDFEKVVGAIAEVDESLAETLCICRLHIAPVSGMVDSDLLVLMNSDQKRKCSPSKEGPSSAKPSNAGDSESIALVVKNDASLKGHTFNYFSFIEDPGNLSLKTFTPVKFTSIGEAFEQTKAFEQRRRTELSGLYERPRDLLKLIFTHGITVWQGQSYLDAIICAEIITDHMKYPYLDRPLHDTLYEAVRLVVPASLGEPFALLAVARTLQVLSEDHDATAKAMVDYARKVLRETEIVWTTESNLFPRLAANEFEYQAFLNHLTSHPELHKSYSNQFINYAIAKTNHRAIYDKSVHAALDTFANLPTTRCDYLFCQQLILKGKYQLLEADASTRETAALMLLSEARDDEEASQMCIDLLAMSHRVPFAVCKAISARLQYRLNLLATRDESKECNKELEELEGDLQRLISMLKDQNDPRYRVFHELYKGETSPETMNALQPFANCLDSSLSGCLWSEEQLRNITEANISAFICSTSHITRWQSVELAFD